MKLNLRNSQAVFTFPKSKRFYFLKNVFQYTGPLDLQISCNWIPPNWETADDTCLWQIVSYMKINVCSSQPQNKSYFHYKARCFFAPRWAPIFPSCSLFSTRIWGITHSSRDDTDQRRESRNDVYEGRSMMSVGDNVIIAWTLPLVASVARRHDHYIRVPLTSSRIISTRI